jgi:hypothetical protein
VELEQSSAAQPPKDLIGFLDYYLVTQAPFRRGGRAVPRHRSCGQLRDPWIRDARAVRSDSGSRAGTLRALAGQIVSALVVGVIAMYVLFQIRPLYKA